MDYQEVYNAVKSALSGNGKLRVNWEIRKLKGCLRNEFGYTPQDFYDLTNDYTCTMLKNHVVRENYNPEISTLQTYMNGVVRNYLLNTLKKLRSERSDWISSQAGEINECDIVCQYDLDINKFLEENEGNTENLIRPDEIYEYQELKALVRKYLRKTYRLVFEGRLTQERAAGIEQEPLSSFNRNYKNSIDNLVLILKEAGYLDEDGKLVC